jgi:hypothetical protein
MLLLGFRGVRRREDPLPQLFLPPTLYKNPSLPRIATSALKMGTVCFSETLASTDESARRHNPEEQDPPHRRENL